MRAFRTVSSGNSVSENVLNRTLGTVRCYKRRSVRRPFVIGCCLDVTFLYNIAVTDPSYIVQNLTEYFSGVMCLVLTFHCWRLDWRGRASATTKASYLALVCLLLLIMALPAMGL